MTAAPSMRPARSLLFVPGDRPERFAKAAASGAHQVVLDLEDAVAPDAKDGARAAVAAWLQQGQRAVVRINAADTPWHAGDIAMLRACPGAALMLPKAEAHSLPDVLAALAGESAAAALPNRELIALIETVRGVIDVRAVAATTGVTRLAFGSVDFALDSGIADEDGAMDAVRTQIVLASCLGGLGAPIDGVSTEFNDAGLIALATTRSRRLGFGGKLCIHPRQVGPVNAAFLPTPAQVQWARQVLDAFATSRGAAVAVDGKMIDLPVVQRARGIVADADADADANVARAA